MSVPGIKQVTVVVAILIAVVLLNCIDGTGRKEGPRLATTGELDKTIGSVAEVVAFESVPVEGYGLVAGLAETGSSECPPRIREYLKQFILRRLPGLSKISAEELVNSRDTAVVRIYGLIPSVASKGQRFDVVVVALEGTQTTSLAGGRLYTAELSPYTGWKKSSRILADAQGPILIDKIENNQVDERKGYILGGGSVADNYRFALALTKPDYQLASAIRNRLNQRFEVGTADAVSSGIIYLNLPDKYKGQKTRFVSLVKAMYVTEQEQLADQRISKLVRELAVGKDKDAAEAGLEVIGKMSLKKLPLLLNSSDKEVRFRAARCMLSLGDESGLGMLREMALKGPKQTRIEAINAIGRVAKRNDATAILKDLAGDGDFEVRMAAYEHLTRLEDISVTRQVIGGNFYLETVQRGGPKVVYVSRRLEPKIVLFGGRIRCRQGFFVESADGSVIIDAPADKEFISVMRRHPKRGTLMGPLQSSFELVDIIKTLGEEPVRREEMRRIGLGLPYSDVAAILKKMCEKGVVPAEFHIGPSPELELNIKKFQSSDR
jgi:flagellar basal body P-ring protein FlgI